MCLKIISTFFNIFGLIFENFQHFCCFHQQQLLVFGPTFIFISTYNFPFDNIKHLSELFNCDLRELQSELIDLQNEPVIKANSLILRWNCLIIPILKCWLLKF